MVEKLDFITPTVTRVLDLFLGDPMGEYHEREVMRRARVSKGSANRILRLLAKEGFLVRQRKGRMMFYSLDIKEPVVRQFKVLSNVYSLKPLIGQLKVHARRVVLFGSSAEGTDVKESDLDVFVLTNEKSAVTKAIAQLSRKYARKIAPIVVNATELVRLRRDDRPLYENIEQGVVLWETE
jgi:predicted nucleotidyltransferase